MNLKDFLKQLGSDERRSAFAAACETSLGHLKNVSNGKTCGPALAVAIEEQSGGAVTRQTMRPHDWHRIWPDLRETAEQVA